MNIKSLFKWSLLLVVFFAYKQFDQAGDRDPGAKDEVRYISTRPAKD